MATIQNTLHLSILNEEVIENPERGEEKIRHSILMELFRINTKRLKYNLVIKLSLYRLATVFLIIFLWLVIFLPIILTNFDFIKFQFNITNNNSYSKELRKINLTSYNNIICPDTYIFNPTSQICETQCGVWHLCGPVCHLIHHILIASASIMGIIIGIVTLILWICVRRSLNKFPQITLFFLTILGTLLSILLGITDIPGPYYFYCRGLDISYDKEISTISIRSIRIQLYGSLLNYVYIAFLLWLVFSFLNIFIGIRFPIEKYLMKVRSKWILFTIESIVTWSLPLLPIIITYSSGNFFNFSQFPHQIAIDNPYIAFIAFLGPLFLLICVSMTLVIIILYIRNTWRIHSDQELLNLNLKPKEMPISILEIRLMILCVIFFFIVLIVVIDVVGFIYYSEPFNYFLNEFEACITFNAKIILQNMTIKSELSVYNLSNYYRIEQICEREFLNYSLVWITFISDFSVRTLWMVMLVFVSIKDFRRICLRPIKKLQRMFKRKI